MGGVGRASAPGTTTGAPVASGGPAIAPPGSGESIGGLLTRLRRARGLSQLRLAERLCVVAATPTVTRHEVSRWEREARVPGGFWLGWLAVVLEVPQAELVRAVAVARGADGAADGGSVGHHRLWRPPDETELLTALDARRSHDLRELAHVWLVGPPGSSVDAAADGRTEGADGGPAIDPLTARLRDLRRMDDLVGGADLAPLVDRELRAVIATLGTRARERHRRPVLRLVAEYAQLAGWVHTDAGDRAAARQAFRVALRAAAASRDRPLAAYVLAALSHHLLTTGDPHEALLLARTAWHGLGDAGSAHLRALLQHRVALAAAWVRERTAAYAALAAADQCAERAEPGQEPPWLYWLDQAELSAMTGRCLIVLGRPLRAVRLLKRPRRPGVGPRTIALYDSWLARGYLEVGEVERACRVAARGIRNAVRAGSVRAATGLRHLRPLLARHHDLPAVRRYERLVDAASGYLPTGDRGGRARAGRAGMARICGGGGGAINVRSVAS